MFAEDLPDGSKITAQLHESRIQAEIISTGQSIAEIGQQLGWIGAALRLSPVDLPVTLCWPFVQEITLEGSLRLTEEEASKHPLRTKLN